MAEKRIYQRAVTFRMKISEIKPEHIYTNEKGEKFADFRMLLSDEAKESVFNGNTFIDHGFVMQQVNSETYKREKDLPNDQKTNMPILGNARVYIKGAGGGSADSHPGYEGGAGTNTPGAAPAPAAAPVKDKLPF